MSFNKEYFSNLFQAHPELLTFLTKGIDATHDYNVTEMSSWMTEMYQAATEILSNAKISIKVEPLASLIKAAVIGQRSIELERTMLCIMAMDSVVEGNYKFFEEAPTTFGAPITKDQFEYLHTLLATYFPSENKKILLHELIFGDLGKIRSLREALCKQFEIEVQDPDQFMSALLNRNYEALAEILPSVANLTNPELIELRKTNTGFHYGHFAHTESTERELKKLKAIIDERGIEYLYKNILVQIFDVAGAAAQDRGKILLNKTVASTYLDDILPALLKLKSESPEQVYTDYLVKRLKICKILPQEKEIDKLEPIQRLLSRLICMFRIYGESDALRLKKALDGLSNNIEFVKNLETLDDYQSISQLQTPTYMPALLNTLKASPRIMELAVKGEDNEQTVALRVGLQLIANALKLHKQLVTNGKMKNQNPVNFNGLTGLVKSDFDAIKTLHSNNDVSFGKNDGIAYPTKWITQNKSSELSNFMSQYGSLDKTTITKANKYDGFEAHIFLEGKDPRKIQICKTNSHEIIIEFNTNAVDCMGFSNIDDRLEKLEQKEQEAAIHCFAETLKQYYGGKNLLALPSKFSEIFYKEGFRTSPETPSGSSYKRLMFVKRNELEKKLADIIVTQNEKLQVLDKKYTVISDKIVLQKRAEEISRLFIDNASYASNIDKRKGYSAQAIIHRINNENTYPFAIQDIEGKIIGFMRVYIASGIGAYASDLVTLSEKRHQGLAILLMQKAFLELKNNADTVFLIAGDDIEAEYYEKKLGCKAIYSQKEPLNLAEEKVFMFGLIPQQSLLKKFLSSFPMPEDSKAVKLPSAAELSKFHIVASSSSKAPLTSLEEGEQNKEATISSQMMNNN